MKGFICIMAGLLLIGWSVYIAKGSRRAIRSNEERHALLDSEYRGKEDWSRGIPGKKDSLENNANDVDFGTDIPLME